MPYVDGCWSYAERDYQIQGGCDPTRRALEVLQRRIEEFLFDDRSENHGDCMFVAWAMEQADQAKNSSGSLHEALMGAEYDAELYLSENPTQLGVGQSNTPSRRRNAVGRASDAVRYAEPNLTSYRAPVAGPHIGGK